MMAGSNLVRAMIMGKGGGVSQPHLDEVILSNTAPMIKTRISTPCRVSSCNYSSSVSGAKSRVLSTLWVMTGEGECSSEQEDMST